MAIPQTGFISNVNSVADNLATIKDAANLFDVSTVAILNQIAALDITEVVEDLKKGNYLGNRKLDIDLLLNNLSTTTNVAYSQVTLTLKDGTVVPIPFLENLAVLELTSHADIKNYIENDAAYSVVVNTELTVEDAVGDLPQVIRFRDSDGTSSNVDRVELVAYSGSYSNSNPTYIWTDTTSSLQTLANRAGDILLLGQSIDEIIVLSNITDDIAATAALAADITALALQIAAITNLHSSLSTLTNLNTNMASMLSVYNNMPDINSIVTSILPSLAEILLADDNAATATTAANNASTDAGTAAVDASNAAISAATALGYLNSLTALTTVTNTLVAGSSASSSYNSGTGVLTLGIPQGDQGVQGEAFAVDAFGLLATRSTYDAQALGFSFLAVDTSDIYFKQSATSGDWSAGVPFGKGDQGIQGIQGLGWYTGAGVPSDGMGEDGEMYLNESNADVYAKAGGTWGAPTTNLAAAIDDLSTSSALSWSSQKVSDELALKSDTTHNHTATYEPINANIQAHIIDTANPHAVTKAQVGLTSVDDTSDINKPVSTAQQTALDAKVDDGQVLTNVPGGALFTDTIYSHPSADGDLHVPATSTTNAGKVLTAGPTAGDLTWEVPAVTYTHPLNATTDVTTTGAEVIDTIVTSAEGHITTLSKRTMTLGDIGALGATANAVTASKWLAARTITLGGDLTGNVIIDGSANATLTATVTDSALVGGVAVGSLLRSDVADTVSANITFVDSARAYFGTSADFSIWHNGSSNLVDLIGHNLVVRDNVTTRFTFARTTGAFTATGNITAYSDVRLKENFEPITNALEKVAQLNGVTYDRKDIETDRQTGLKAQEVQAVLPEAVMADDEGILSVAYGNMMGLMVEAIKELKAEVTELKAELAEVKGE